jgi:sorbitol/mannitol transport system substrate-binding protein
MANRPTWTDIRTAAEKLHDPKAGRYGVCLRGKPGWGDNMALLSTMVNTWGGQWFGMDWRPQIDAKPWQEAVGFYVDLLKRFGPPDAASNSFNENLQLFAQGRCAIWVDATAAGTALSDPRLSKVTGQTGFALAPTALTPKGASWLWAWALAIPATSRQADAAQRFVRWATSEDYLSLVGKTAGWAALPSGTRYSTYRRPEFRAAARFAMIEAVSIAMADPNAATQQPAPYVGVQFASIPEFQAIGHHTGQQISAALAGQQSVTQALTSAQTQAEQVMRQAGYVK